MVAGRLDPPAVLADRPPSSASAAAADPAMLAAVAGDAAPASAARSPPRRCRCAPSSSRATVPARRPPLALAEQAADDLKAAGKIVGDLTFTPTDAAP